MRETAIGVLRGFDYAAWLKHWRANDEVVDLQVELFSYCIRGCPVRLAVREAPLCDLLDLSEPRLDFGGVPYECAVANDFVKRNWRENDVRIWDGGAGKVIHGR